MKKNWFSTFMNRFRISILAWIDCSFRRLPDSDASDCFSPRRLSSAVTMTPVFPRAEYITPCLKVKLMTFDKWHPALLPRGHFANLRRYALEPKLTAAVWRAQLHFPAPSAHRASLTHRPWTSSPGPMEQILLLLDVLFIVLLLFFFHPQSLKNK